MQNHNYSTPSQVDEIDLFALIAVFWSRKWVVIGATVATILAVNIYIIITPKIFEAKVIVGQASLAVLEQLNTGKDALGYYSQSFTPSSAFTLFSGNLQSRPIAMDYFKKYIEPFYRNKGSEVSINDLLDNSFLKSISVSKSGTENVYLTISHQYTDPLLTAEWLNGYLRYVEQKTKEALVSSAEKNKALAIAEYEKEIESLRAIYNQELQDRIVLLEEAYSVARKINLKNFFVNNLAKEVQSKALDESLLYLRGYEVLDAEIELLKLRKLVDPYIPQVRSIQRSIKYLDSIEYDLTTLGVVSVNAWAVEPEKEIRPKKRLMLILAGLLGFMVGVFLALVLAVISKRKQSVTV